MRRLGPDLQKALVRDPDDGLCCYYFGLCQLQQGQLDQAMHWGYRATRCFGTVSLGYDLVGRAEMVAGRPAQAVHLFQRAVAADGHDRVAADHLALARYASGQRDAARELARVERLRIQRRSSRGPWSVCTTWQP